MNQLTVFKWLGTTFTISGAVVTAVSTLKPSDINITLFMLGSFFWLCAAIKMRDKPLISVNFVLLSIYVIGFTMKFLGIKG